MSAYSYKLDGDRYVVYDDNTILTTPGGNNVTTLYEPLAKRIVLDLDRYGMNFHSAESILAWHFTMIDNFVPLGHERVEMIMTNSFLSHVDWTCQERYSQKWLHVFGNWASRQDDIKQWLSKITLMQLTAACCIGNAYESLNISLVLARILEKYQNTKREEKLIEIAELITDTYQFGTFDVIYNDFKTFELYYGFHLEENGPVLNDIIIDCDHNEKCELNVDDLSNYHVSVEQLIGRNFYHYTNGKIDEIQPAGFSFSELQINDVNNGKDEEVAEEDNDAILEESSDNECPSELADYLPDDCWVKRFVDNDDPNTFYLLYISLDETNTIVDSGCIEETSIQMGASFYFIVPGIEAPSVKSYGYNSYPPQKVINDLHLLFSGVSIPLNFLFVGKHLPRKVLEELGNDGGNNEYTYAIQSAFRLAYMHMSVYTTENGTIESLSYSTYQSSGSAYEDMFTRPTILYDRKDEALDTLLHFFDLYTYDELDEYK